MTIFIDAITFIKFIDAVNVSEKLICREETNKLELSEKSKNIINPLVNISKLFWLAVQQCSLIDTLLIIKFRRSLLTEIFNEVTEIEISLLLSEKRSPILSLLLNFPAVESSFIKNSSLVMAVIFMRMSPEECKHSAVAETLCKKSPIFIGILDALSPAPINVTRKLLGGEITITSDKNLTCVVSEAACVNHSYDGSAYKLDVEAKKVCSSLEVEMALMLERFFEHFGLYMEPSYVHEISGSWVMFSKKHLSFSPSTLNDDEMNIYIVKMARISTLLNFLGIAQEQKPNCIKISGKLELTIEYMDFWLPDFVTHGRYDMIENKVSDEGIKGNLLYLSEQIKMLQELACIDPGMIKMIVSENIKTDMKRGFLIWAQALLELGAISIEDVQATVVEYYTESGVFGISRSIYIDELIARQEYIQYSLSEYAHGYGMLFDVLGGDAGKHIKQQENNYSKELELTIENISKLEVIMPKRMSRYSY